MSVEVELALETRNQCLRYIFVESVERNANGRRLRKMMKRIGKFSLKRQTHRSFRRRTSFRNYVCGILSTILNFPHVKDPVLPIELLLLLL